jgi:hypothetical protein
MSAQGTPAATANAAGGPIHHGSHGLLVSFLWFEVNEWMEGFSTNSIKF